MLLLLMLFHTITLPAWLVLAWLRVCMCLWRLCDRVCEAERVTSVAHRPTRAAVAAT